MGTMINCYGVNPYSLTEAQVYELKSELMGRGYSTMPISIKSS